MVMANGGSNNFSLNVKNVFMYMYRIQQQTNDLVI